ncbi:hypothetical protein HJG60_011206 [Phyllostomus discolor]|uniref:Uncharacterized protein n=1 Tax=Phyllostomus discolor TaxID=89673 RepID=A0A834A289_9CHIR|nr:hypothetical protein HJG60_011206 [Phyllostomus discolor]
MPPKQSIKTKGARGGAHSCCSVDKRTVETGSQPDQPEGQFISENYKTTRTQDQDQKTRRPAWLLIPRQKPGGPPDFTSGLASGLLNRPSGYLPGDISEDFWNLRAYQDLQIPFAAIAKATSGEKLLQGHRHCHPGTCF